MDFISKDDESFFTECVYILTIIGVKWEYIFMKITLTAISSKLYVAMAKSFIPIHKLVTNTTATPIYPWHEPKQLCF